MRFTSTRSRCDVASAQAIAQGLANDGGLFVPMEFPAFTAEDFATLTHATYLERAEAVLSRYLTDFTAEEICNAVANAYTGTFDEEDPAPLKEIAPGTHMLELWHGPTCAFKDMALQLLPHLLTTAAGKVAPEKTIVILVATSGDTGKAALDGFADVPGTRIVVFYPRDGVSAMQKRQMTTQTGANVTVCAIEGNFDNAQTGVKMIFSDDAMKAELAAQKMEFSSANSINFGRLVPQIVYYVSAYCDLLRSGKLKAGEAFHVAVPTGNFGNILAAVYAKNMGVPIGKFLCASNRNCILTDFIRTGVYDRNREFYTTTSPSMDILISSNLERMLYHLHGNDPARVAALMTDLKEKGRYEVAPDVLEKLQQIFVGGWCDDDAVQETIRKNFRENQYLCDTHTAVALHVLDQYRAETGDQTPCVVASTASPYKFAPAVLRAICDSPLPEDEFAMVELLSECSGTPIPAPLANLRNSEVLHKHCIAKESMAEFVRKTLQA